MSDQQPSERAKQVANLAYKHDSGIHRELCRRIDHQFPAYDALLFACEGWLEVERQAEGEDVEMPAHLSMAMAKMMERTKVALAAAGVEVP